MLYMILGQDAPDNLPLRREHRPAHVARLKALQEQGRLILSGPRPRVDALDPGEAGFFGGLIVAEFPNLQAAQEWVSTDPFVVHGVYAQVDVQPFIKVLPA